MAAEIDITKKFTGKYDKKGNPIYEGSTLIHGGLNFMVVQWGEYPTEDGGVIVGYYIPDDCEVIADADKLSSERKVKKN